MIGRLLGLSLWLPLKDRLFRRLFVGEGVALLADQMFLISLTLLVLEVAGPGAQLGSVLAVASIPGALLMLVGGWVSDRFPPAAVLVVSNAGRAALMAVLAWIVLSDASNSGISTSWRAPWGSSTPSTTRLPLRRPEPRGEEEARGGQRPRPGGGADQRPRRARAGGRSGGLLGLGATFAGFALMFLATSASSSR